MLLMRVMARVAGLLALAVCLGACIPDANPVDEQKDPHYQRGLKLVNSQDYKGAVEEFERALESNPHSAAAHFELGCLYDKLGDNAAAIYHYDRHLKLRPNSDQAQVVNERIHGCKQDLANTEFSPHITQNLQREVDRLTAENAALRQQLAAWQRPAQAPADPPPPRAEAARLAAHDQPATAPPVRGATPPPPRLNVAGNIQSVAAAPAPSHPRVHIVKPRETVHSIALQYGLSVSTVLAANPRVDPRRLRIGQNLALP
jgi:tetratricopeptide (TPR) repeat protein